MNGFELILPFLRPIQHLILDPDISEIMVNGPEHIFIEKAGYLQAVPGIKLTPESLIVAVKNIARRLGDDISDEKPILDSRLPDGSRVAAVIPPCSIHGVALTIRKFNSRRLKMENLVEAGTLTTDLAERLKDYIVNRKNILICGGTSSGKTTLANVLTEFIPNHERIVLIEDTAEIQIQKENVLRFEARREQNGLPAVTIRDLLKATLRHRPDRIILGEIRGGEAFDLLQLLNTGHSGTLSTVHANSAAQGISRFTTCVLQSAVEMPYRAIKANIAESLDVIIQIERQPGFRFVSEIIEIGPYSPELDNYELRRVFLRQKGASVRSDSRETSSPQP
jgi:pilus assembly protein CpaF